MVQNDSGGRTSPVDASGGAKVFAKRAEGTVSGPMGDPAGVMPLPSLTASLDSRGGVAVPPLNLPDVGAAAAMSSRIGAFLGDAVLRGVGGDVLTEAHSIMPGDGEMGGYRSRAGTVRSAWSNPDAVVQLDGASITGRSAVSGQSSTTTPDPPGMRGLRRRSGGTPDGTHTGGDSDGEGKSVVGDLLGSTPYLAHLTRHTSHTAGGDGEGTEEARRRALRAKYSTYPPRGRGRGGRKARSLVRRSRADGLRRQASSGAGSEAYTGLEGDGSSTAGSTTGDSVTALKGDSRSWCVLERVLLLEVVKGGHPRLEEVGQRSGQLPAPHVPKALRPLSDAAVAEAGATLSDAAGACPAMAFTPTPERRQLPRFDSTGSSSSRALVMGEADGSPDLAAQTSPSLTLPHQEGLLESQPLAVGPLRLLGAAGASVTAWMAAGGALGPAWGKAVQRAALIARMRTQYGPAAAALGRVPFQWLLAAAEAADARSAQEADGETSNAPSVAGSMKRMVYCSILPDRGLYIVHAPFARRPPQMKRYGAADGVRRDTGRLDDGALWDLRPPRLDMSMTGMLSPSAARRPVASVFSTAGGSAPAAPKESWREELLCEGSKSVLDAWSGRLVGRAARRKPWMSNSPAGLKRWMEGASRQLVWSVLSSPHTLVHLLAYVLQKSGGTAGGRQPPPRPTHHQEILTLAVRYSPVYAHVRIAGYLK